MPSAVLAGDLKVRALGSLGCAAAPRCRGTVVPGRPYAYVQAGERWDGSCLKTRSAWRGPRRFAPLLKATVRSLAVRAADCQRHTPQVWWVHI